MHSISAPVSRSAVAQRLFIRTAFLKLVVFTLLVHPVHSASIPSSMVLIVRMVASFTVGAPVAFHYGQSLLM